MTRSGLGAGVLLAAGASACASPAVAAVDFHCTVKGEALLGAAATPAAVCARMKAGIDAALGTTTRAAVADRAGTTRGDWVEVEVRFDRPGTAAAQLRRRQGGAVAAFPELGMAVLDRPLGLDIVDQLAAQLGRQLR